MGFPVGYTEIILPNLFLYTLSILGFIRNLVNFIFSLLGLQDYLDPPDISSSWPPPPPPLQWHATQPYDAVSIQESLPATVNFSELIDPPENCAVCLYEFEDEDEIRPLVNCRHVFHGACLDRWIGYCHRTCPLCRTPLMNEQLNDISIPWPAASGIPDVYGDFSQIRAGF